MADRDRHAGGNKKPCGRHKALWVATQPHEIAQPHKTAQPLWPADELNMCNSLLDCLLHLLGSSGISMAEIGAIASIFGVAGAGAKLSIQLFEFATTVGAAGLEVRQIGTEISLFCSVLKQLQSTLTKAKAYRYSISAIETTEEILDRCQQVFTEIKGIVDRLRKRGGGRSVESSVDLIARVKWTFKRSQVQLLRATLESCKITLHIMLTTLEFAQKIATRRVSTAEARAEDEHERTLTHSLIIAHQCTVDTLERLEDEEVQQLSVESGGPSPPLTPGPPSVARVLGLPAKRKPSQSSSSRNFQASSPTRGVQEKKRASVWVNDLMFDKSPLPPGFRRQTWGDEECAKFLEQHPYYFLQKWTDQGEHLNRRGRLDVDATLGKYSQTKVVDGETIPPTSSSRTIPNPFSRRFADPKLADPSSASNTAADMIVFENFYIGINDPCWKVLAAFHKEYNIPGPCESYALYLIYGDKERPLGPEELPLAIFRQLKKEGIEPECMLRKIKPGSTGQGIPLITR